MRLFGFALMMLGVAMSAAGFIVGCSGLVNESGRHEVRSYPLELGTPLRTEFAAVAGRRYTAGIQVVFARDEEDVKAKLPLVGSIDDGSSTARVVGFLDPSEPPTTLVGRSGPNSELRAERLMGPYAAPSDRPVKLAVDLRPDSLGKTEVAASRVVLYDDARPPSVLLGFVAGGVGGIAFLGGGVVLVRGGRRRKKRS